MKERRDLVRGLLRKARSDLAALDGSVSTGALDAACFHAQQACEKHLKAYLIAAGVEYPFTHNLTKLVELAATFDPAFQTLEDQVAALTPYAVELRYDYEFWPDVETVESARVVAREVQRFVTGRLADHTNEV
jgi:HEPN domain-containing protein